MELDKNLIGGSTRLLLLSLLSESDRYGYDIIRTLAERSQNVFAFKEGTLYPVLHENWRPRAASAPMKRWWMAAVGGITALPNRVKSSWSRNGSSGRPFRPPWRTF